MAWFIALAPYIAGASTVMQSASQMQSARETEGITRYNILTTERTQKAREAQSIQEAKEIKRQANLQKSRVLAIAAASGGSALDPDVLNMIAGFETEGDLAARTALYEGKEDVAALKSKGKVMAYEGSSRARSLRNESVGTIMSGASSFASKYSQLSR